MSNLSQLVFNFCSEVLSSCKLTAPKEIYLTIIFEIWPNFKVQSKLGYALFVGNESTYAHLITLLVQPSELFWYSVTLPLYGLTFLLCKYLIPLPFGNTTTYYSLIYVAKFILLIALLVLIRGGIPRYRFDFLTKIGWIKFLNLVVSFFLSLLLLILIL